MLRWGRGREPGDSFQQSFYLRSAMLRNLACSNGYTHYVVFQMLIQELDQCYYCLYKHPSNPKKAKSSGLLDHSAEPVHNNTILNYHFLCVCIKCVSCKCCQNRQSFTYLYCDSCHFGYNCTLCIFPFQIPLTWESALMLIERVHPSALPSIDDSKSPQVTQEVSDLQYNK